MVRGRLRRHLTMRPEKSRVLLSYPFTAFSENDKGNCGKSAGRR